MRACSAVLLIASMAFSLVSAGIDYCPPNTHEVGEKCTLTPDGPHACSGAHINQVLQCNNGKWAVRNYCAANYYCGCTSQHDIVCKKISHKIRGLARSDYEAEAEVEAEAE